MIWGVDFCILIWYLLLLFCAEFCSLPLRHCYSEFPYIFVTYQVSFNSKVILGSPYIREGKGVKLSRTFIALRRANSQREAPISFCWQVRLLGYMETQEVCWRVIGCAGGGTSKSLCLEESSRLQWTCLSQIPHGLKLREVISHGVAAHLV